MQNEQWWVQLPRSLDTVRSVWICLHGFTIPLDVVILGTPNATSLYMTCFIDCYLVTLLVPLSRNIVLDSIVQLCNTLYITFVIPKCIILVCHDGIIRM
jgi:hypothetical protein